MDICVASPRPDSLMLRGLVEPAQILLKGHLMLHDNYGLYMDIESTCYVTARVWTVTVDTLRQRAKS